MRVLVVNDGTIPIVVATVLYTDGDDLPDESNQSDDKWDCRMAEIRDGSAWLGVAWTDSDGFQYEGIGTLGDPNAIEEARGWLVQGWHGAGSVKGPEWLNEGHAVVTHNPEDPDHEGYAHIFRLW